MSPTKNKMNQKKKKKKDVTLVESERTPMVPACSSVQHAQHAGAISAVWRLQAHCSASPSFSRCLQALESAQWLSG